MKAIFVFERGNVTTAENTHVSDFFFTSFPTSLRNS